MDGHHHPEVVEQLFHNTVREYTVKFVEDNKNNYYAIGFFIKHEESFNKEQSGERKAYNLTVWSCTFSLAVSLGAALLLPISIFSNEILLMYPKSYYMKWLNSSLIQELWSLIFLLSNFNLFALLPFTYLFSESEGFPGCHKNYTSRIYEAFCVLSLLSFFFVGFLYIISLTLKQITIGFLNFICTISKSLTLYTFIFLHRFTFHVLMYFILRLCIPVGSLKFLTLVSSLITNPFKHEDESYCIRLDNLSFCRQFRDADQHFQDDSFLQDLNEDTHLSAIHYLGYPFIWLLLLVFLGVILIFVINNTLQLLVGIRALPHTSKNFTLGINSLSSLGPAGAILEVILVIYLLATSVVGLYSLPLFYLLTPKQHGTSTLHLLINAILLLLLTSALPLLTHTLGITNFDLLGQFGDAEWLGNFIIVLSCNLFFVTMLSLCLANTLTAPLRKEIAFRLNTAWIFIRTWGYSPSEIKED